MICRNRSWLKTSTTVVMTTKHRRTKESSWLKQSCRRSHKTLYFEHNTSSLDNWQEWEETLCVYQSNVTRLFTPNTPSFSFDACGLLVLRFKSTTMESTKIVKVTKYRPYGIRIFSMSVGCNFVSLLKVDNGQLYFRIAVECSFVCGMVQAETNRSDSEWEKSVIFPNMY